MATRIVGVCSRVCMYAYMYVHIHAYVCVPAQRHSHEHVCTCTWKPKAHIESLPLVHFILVFFLFVTKFFTEPPQLTQL